MSARTQDKPKAPAAAPDALQEVVVTGSRIGRPDFDRLADDHRQFGNLR